MAREVAGAYGIAVEADPQPLRNVFIRSDQYNFIVHGIPALAMAVGENTARRSALAPQCPAAPRCGCCHPSRGMADRPSDGFSWPRLGGKSFSL